MYTSPFSRPYRGFHDFHVFSRTFMVFARPFAHIFTYVLWFSRPSRVFTPTPCFHVHTVIFEFIWPNGLWTHFSCPNGPPARFTTVLDVRRARSDEKVARRPREFAYHHSFGRPTITFCVKGCFGDVKICISPQFWASDDHFLR